MKTFAPTRQVKITSVRLPHAPPPLPFNRKVGPITVGPNRPMGRDKRYFASCDCGHSGWYQVADLLAILDSKSGCGQPKCNALSFRAAVWRTEDSLPLQLFTLLLICPQDVESLWGGTFDDLYEVGFEEACANLLPHLEGSGAWLCRKDLELPFIEGNVYLGSKPDPAIQGAHKARIEVDGTPMKMRELCEIAGLGVYDLLMKLYKLGTTDDLLFHLLEE